MILGKDVIRSTPFNSLLRDQFLDVELDDSEGFTFNSLLRDQPSAEKSVVEGVDSLSILSCEIRTVKANTGGSVQVTFFQFSLARSVDFDWRGASMEDIFLSILSCEIRSGTTSSTSITLSRTFNSLLRDQQTSYLSPTIPTHVIFQFSLARSGVTEYPSHIIVPSLSILSCEISGRW